MKNQVNRLLQTALAVCCLVVASCQQAPPAQVEAEYEVMTIAPADRTLTSVYSATIRGRQDIEIYPQVSGFLTKVCVTEGEHVRQGQTLFIIDQVAYEAALQTAQANVKAAEASLATAQLTYDSKQELFRQNVVSEFDLSTAHNSLLTAKAQLAQMKAQEVSARNNLSYTVVKSPSNGVVGTLPYRVGALVSASLPEPLTTVSDNSDMYVYFSMTEKELLALTKAGGTLKEQLEKMPAVRLQLADGSTYHHEGKIDAVSGVIDQSTGSVSMRAIFSNEGNVLRSGGTGNIIFPYTMNNIITIPQSATVEIQDKKFVFVLQPDNTVKNTEIKVSNLNDGKNYLVTGGLKSGDKIVVEGVQILKDGQEIQPITREQQKAKFEQALKDQHDGNLQTAFN